MLLRYQALIYLVLIYLVPRSLHLLSAKSSCTIPCTILLPTFSTGTIPGTYFVLATTAPCTIFCPRCLSGTIIRSTVGRLRASGTSLPGYGKDRIMTQRSSTLSEIEPPELGKMKIIVETCPAFSESSERAFLDPDFAELLVKKH